MNGFQYAVAAWLPTVIFPETMALKFRRGFPGTFGLVIATLVSIVVIQLLNIRSSKKGNTGRSLKKAMRSLALVLSTFPETVVKQARSGKLVVKSECCERKLLHWHICSRHSLGSRAKLDSSYNQYRVTLSKDMESCGYRSYERLKSR